MPFAMSTTAETTGTAMFTKGLSRLHSAEYRERRQRDKDDAVRAAVIVDDPAAHAEPLSVGAVRRAGQHLTGRVPRR